MTAQRMKAAILVAEDELTDEQIAREVGIKDRTTIWRWKDVPAFQAAVATHRQRLELSVSRFWIAKRRKRVEVIQRLVEGGLSVIEQRAAAAPSSQNTPEGDRHAPVRDRVYNEELDEWTDPEDEWVYPNVRDAVPGLNTGLIVKDIKSVGYGDDAELVDVYRVDTPLMNEIRQGLKQAAQEVGQWTEKRELGAAEGTELAQVVFVMPVKGSKPEIYPHGPNGPPGGAGEALGASDEGEDDV